MVKEVSPDLANITLSFMFLSMVTRKSRESSRPRSLPDLTKSLSLFSGILKFPLEFWKATQLSQEPIRPRNWSEILLPTGGV